MVYTTKDFPESHLAYCTGERFVAPNSAPRAERPQNTTLLRRLISKPPLNAYSALASVINANRNASDFSNLGGIIKLNPSTFHAPLDRESHFSPCVDHVFLWFEGASSSLKTLLSSPQNDPKALPGGFPGLFLY